jgi:phospholipid N-methyltransferase
MNSHTAGDRVNGHQVLSNRRANGRASLAGIALFAQNFFTHPRMLGSIVPSSRYLIRRLLSHIDFASARTIVELGPGIGNITTSLLSQLSPHGRVIALDTNEDFVRSLRRTIHDPRLTVLNTSAELLGQAVDENGGGPVDYVLSGIPFSILPPPLRRSVMEQVYQVLRPGGALLVYQFSPAAKHAAQEFFPEIHQEFEWLNVLPAHVFRCTRPLANGSPDHRSELA